MNKFSTQLNFRIDDSTRQKLDYLVAKTGKNQTDVLKELINNSRSNDFKMVAKTDNDVRRELELVSTRKYLNFLLKNLTNNVNQIARNLNTANVTDETKDYFLDEFSNLENEINDVKKKIKVMSNDK